MKKIKYKIAKFLGLRLPMNDCHPLDIEIYVENMVFWGMVATISINVLLTFLIAY